MFEIQSGIQFQTLNGQKKTFTYIDTYYPVKFSPYKANNTRGFIAQSFTLIC